jgi:peptidoglycan/xylan/chitin deacetylase (PgdA/CDA1 family)
MLDIYLKGCDAPQARAFLSEDDLETVFSPLQKIYYSAVRPIMPLFARHLLQEKWNEKKECRPNFIWDELVELLRKNDAVWQGLTSALYPEGCNTAIVLTHDVETQEGYEFIPRIIEIENRYGFRSSWNLVAHKYSLHRPITDLIVERGHEIGIHGYNHDGTLYYSKDRFLRRAAYINEALRKYGAVGFRSPQVHRNLAWLQHLDILYDASCFDYDPYQPFPGGTGSIWPFMAGKFVELPYTVPQDHTLFYALKVRDISIWKKKTKWLAENQGMILTLTHPDYLMRERRLAFYEEYLSYLNEIPRAWRCLPREMAARYRAL